jgi:hemerythrin-like domain-containing protein
MKAAIQELMDDHQVILRVCGGLRGLSLKATEGAKPNLTDLEAALDFIRTFADYCHHGKEEDLLFPAMEEAGFPRDGGPLAVMLMEHAQGREYVRTLAAALERVKAGEAPAIEGVLRSASGYAELLTAHIFKEDQILYPMALSALPEDRWEVLRVDFARVESERMGPEKRGAYMRWAERLAAAYPSPGPSQRMGPFCH